MMGTYNAIGIVDTHHYPCSFREIARLKVGNF